jgi:membrane protein YdbS with pleckstrin-like domain
MNQADTLFIAVGVGAGIGVGLALKKTNGFIGFAGGLILTLLGVIILLGAIRIIFQYKHSRYKKRKK